MTVFIYRKWNSSTKPAENTDTLEKCKNLRRLWSNFMQTGVGIANPLSLNGKN